MKKIAVDFLLASAIFGLNFVLVWPLFSGGYTQEMGSIESVFIADARFIAENFPHLGWQPNWYAGFPFHLFYTPILPFSIALANFLIPAVSLASWYRILIGFLYVLSPVSFYFLASYLTKSKWAGFLAALGYSFLPSLAYLLSPVGSVAETYGYAPWRILTLILYGEGGHIAGLAVLPLALLFSLKAIRKYSPKNIILASLIVALLALTNMIALIGYGVMMLVIFVFEIFRGNWNNLGKFGFVILFSLGLSAFWYNTSFIKASLSIGTGGVSGNVGETYLPLLPLLFLFPPLLWLLTMLGRKKEFRLAFLAGGWVLIFFLAVFFWLYSQTMLLPQPNRYLPEMAMGLALLLVWLLEIVKKVFKQPWVKTIFYLLVCFLIICFPLKYIDKIWELTAPHQNIQESSEYQVANWLNNNTDGERVYASGSTAFWLNVFSDTPQIRGGNDGVANSWIRHAIYQINSAENAPSGQEGELSVWWLRALNVSYLVVNFPSSDEIFHDFQFPERFETVEGVERLANLEGDVIYRLPLARPSLAQTVKKPDFENLVEPRNGADAEAIGRYVEYVDSLAEPKSSTTEFFWTGIGQAKIKTKLDEREGVAVQVTYDPGWQARIDGKKIGLKKDVLGFIFLEPKQSGLIEIDLSYRPTLDVWLGYLITLITLVGMLLYFIFYRRKKR